MYRPKFRAGISYTILNPDLGYFVPPLGMYWYIQAKIWDSLVTYVRRVRLKKFAIFGTLRRSMLSCFNSSPVGPELVPYIKMAKIGPYFENEQPRLYLLYFFCCLPDPWGLM